MSRATPPSALVGDRRRQILRRGRFLRAASKPVVAALFSAVLLEAGHALPGDFGRGESPANVLSPLFEPFIIDNPGAAALSEFPLTDEESELRDLARNLLVPPHADEGGLGVGLGRSAPPLIGSVPARQLTEDYVAFIVGAPFRSSTARYARLVDDVRNDLTRMGPFFRVARRVADLDGKRERSLALVQQLSPGEIAHARRRVRENIAVMSDVRDALLVRAAAYRIALERLVIAAPSRAAIEAERLCAELERRAGEIEIVAAPSTRERARH